jgi:nitroreductase
MDIYQAIATRRMIRDFEDRPVPFETLRRILDAGLKAPSNDHMRKRLSITRDGLYGL